MTTPVLVDVERLLHDALAADGAVTAALPGGIHGAVPANPQLPLAVIQRAGGDADEHPWRDRARIQYDVWGSTKQQARDGAAAIHAALRRVVGAHALGVVTAVIDETVLQWLPDPDTARPRYVSVCWAYTHPPA